MRVTDNRYMLPSGGEEWYELVGLHSQEKNRFQSLTASERERE